MSTVSPKPVGKHLIVNAYDVDNAVLCSLNIGLPILNNIVRDLNLTVVNEAGHQFQPHGYTYAFVLSESHMTIHTYPEYNSFYLDIFCCDEHFAPLNALNIIKAAFGVTNIKHLVISR